MSWLFPEIQSLPGISRKCEALIRYANPFSNMKIHSLIFALLVVSVSGCSGNPPKAKSGLSHLGLYIENGPRQGFQYFDKDSTEFNYRYFTIKIVNDTLIPFDVEIDLTGRNAIRVDSFVSTVFLLPRHLTPEEQQFDSFISPELKKFLDEDTGKPEKLNKLLNPDEKLVVTFGVLTNVNDFDPTRPFETRLVPSKKNSGEVSLSLKLNDRVIIPCGSVLFKK